MIICLYPSYSWGEEGQCDYKSAWFKNTTHWFLKGHEHSALAAIPRSLKISATQKKLQSDLSNS